MKKSSQTAVVPQAQVPPPTGGLGRAMELYVDGQSDPAFKPANLAAAMEAYVDPPPTEQAGVSKVVPTPKAPAGKRRR